MNDHHKEARPGPHGDFVRRYGPWALVTGASDGIGQATARELAARGLSLIVVARRQDRLSALKRELEAAHGVSVLALPADLGRDEDVARVVDACRDIEVSLLVAAAGFGTSGPFTESDITSELSMLSVNCRSAVLLTRHFGARFAAQGRGGIVLMGSLLGFQGVPRAAHYAATKAFVQSLAEGLRMELAPRGVDVLSSAPGPVLTGFGSRADMRMSFGDSPAVVARVMLDALGRRTTARPGPFSKLLGWSLMPLPRFLRSRILGLVMDGMTAHQPRTSG
jgi:short-subunit dehydrogenase